MTQFNYKTVFPLGDDTTEYKFVSREYVNIKEFGGFYLGSPGGPAARLGRDFIKKVELVEYEDLGMEAVFMMTVELILAVKEAEFHVPALSDHKVKQLGMFKQFHHPQEVIDRVAATMTKQSRATVLSGLSSKKIG